MANRYIALTLGPNNNPAYAAGATLPASATREVTDLDALFNTLNPKTRKGLQEFIQGSAEQYEGAGRALGQDTEYFPPFLNATNHFFSELVRDQQTFHELPAGNGQGGDDDRRAPRTTHRPNRKREHDLQGDRLPADAAAQGLNSCR